MARANGLLSGTFVLLRNFGEISREGQVHPLTHWKPSVHTLPPEGILMSFKWTRRVRRYRNREIDNSKQVMNVAVVTAVPARRPATG